MLSKSNSRGHTLVAAALIWRCGMQWTYHLVIDESGEVRADAEDE